MKQLKDKKALECYENAFVQQVQEYEYKTTVTGSWIDKYLHEAKQKTMKKSDLKNARIRSYSEDHSKLILKRLFELGIYWPPNIEAKSTSWQWIIITDNPYILQRKNDRDLFSPNPQAAHYRVITLDDLYNIEEEPEWPEFGDNYYTWTTVRVFEDAFTNSMDNEAAKAQGRIFRTAEEAQTDYEFFCFWRKLIAESDGGEWVILYAGHKFKVDEYLILNEVFTPRFSTEEKAKAALAKYRPEFERFKDYLKNGRKQ